MIMVAADHTPAVHTDRDVGLTIGVLLLHHHHHHHRIAADQIFPFVPIVLHAMYL